MVTRRRVGASSRQAASATRPFVRRQSAWMPHHQCFCNGPCCVKSPSDRHVAGLLLLFVVSVGLPHHAVREETASPSKTRDPLSRVLTALLTALPLPSVPATGPQGSGADLAPLQTCSSFRSTPQRLPAPECRAIHPHAVNITRACAATLPSPASCRAAARPPAPSA